MFVGSGCQGGESGNNASVRSGVKRIGGGGLLASPRRTSAGRDREHSIRLAMPPGLRDLNLRSRLRRWSSAFGTLMERTRSRSDHMMVNAQTFSELEELDEANRAVGWNMEYRQLHRGRFSAKIA